MKFLWAAALSILLFVPAARAQAGRQQVAGTVTAAEAQGGKISIQTVKGDTVEVSITDKTFVLRNPPGEKDVKKATKINPSDISAGDRVLAIGQMSADQKSVTASTVYVLLTKSDVAEMHKKEQEDWQKRGTTGIVSAIDAASKTFAIKIGAREIKVQPADGVKYLRYALDSAKLADARPGGFADIKTGDEAHVLGNKSADGASIAAEEVVSGSFKQIAATIEAVNPQTGDLTVKDLATKKTVDIRVNPDSTLKKLPPEMAAILARRYQRASGQGGEEARGGRRGGGDGTSFRPAGQGGPGGGPGGPGGMRGGGPGGDIKQMLDRLPGMALAEMKKGDAIMVSTTEGSDPAHSTAIMLLAGVEPLLTASPSATRDIMSGWNLGGGGGGEGQ